MDIRFDPWPAKDKRLNASLSTYICVMLTSVGSEYETILPPNFDARSVRTLFRASRTPLTLVSGKCLFSMVHSCWGHNSSYRASSDAGGQHGAKCIADLRYI